MKRAYILLTVFTGIATAQQSGQTAADKQSKDKQANQQVQPAPLFGGQIGTRSSQKTKESATLGFNGIDPSGKVEKRMLGASPAAKDLAQVQNMDSAHPSRTELTAFLKQGGLKSK